MTALISETLPPFDYLRLSQRFPDHWPFFLSSLSSGQIASARWSILMRKTGETLEAHLGDLPDFLSTLDEQIHSDGAISESELPFCGGWFVYLGYELTSQIEPTLSLPPSEDNLPMAFAARCGSAVVHDHWTGTVYLVSETDLHHQAAKVEIGHILAEQASGAGLDSGLSNDVGGTQWTVEVEPPAEFEAGVRSILEYIKAGDVFQVNLSRGWRAVSHESVHPLSIFRALCHSNPAPFAGFAFLPGGCIVSSSPERLVERRGAMAQTRPIAGTRPRGHDAVSDARLIEDLGGNLKERAEHIMLIDLERNDLGRVCKPGSVEVDELMVIESYEHVHHIVSNVRGMLEDGATSGDLIRAVFPGGTITGCPKVRCMEIISELEGVGRSFYTGAMGYIGHHGNMDLNILIRSVLVRENQIEFRTGAGIVADSEPSAERKETEFKALGLLNALGVSWEVTDV